MIEEEHGITIHPPEDVDPDPPPPRPGITIARELSGRLLINYLAPWQVRLFTHGRSGTVYATPTPYSPEEAVQYLLYPPDDGLREFAFLIDPGKVDVIVGPMRVAVNAGIQYVLPNGLPEEAIVVPGSSTAHYAIPVH